MMQRHTIVEKPPWWKPRTGRGLMVIAPCLIALCVALAIGTAVIVSKSHSSDTSDSDTEVLPSQPEALVWKYFWRKLHKKTETARIAVQAWLDAHRPVTKKTEKNKPKLDVATTAATRPHVIGTVTKRIETTKSKQDATTNDATRPHVIGTVTKRIETAKPNQDATTNDATWPHVIGTVTKRIETTKPKQDATTNDATRPHVIGTVTKRIETTKPKEDATTNGATRPDEIATTPEPKNTWHSCDTHFCRFAARRIFSKMDHSADPCQDFYQYACGGLLNDTDIPVGEEGISAFTVAERNLQLNLRHVLETSEGCPPSEMDCPSISYELARTLYKSCKNTDAIESKGIDPLLSILKKTRGAGFNTSYWQSLIYILEGLGYSVNYLIKAEVDVDLENNTAHVIYLDQPDFGIPRALLIDDDSHVREYYHDYMMRIGRILDLQLNDLQISVEEILSFEIKLAKISSPDDEHLLDPRLNFRTTLGNLTEEYPDLSWLLTYFEKVLSADIDKDEVVIVKSKKYFSQLGQLLSSTDAQILVDYIMWRAIMDSTIYMNDEIRNETLAFKQHQTGVVAQRPRWRECVDVVSNKLPLSAYTTYSQRHHPPSDWEVLETFLGNHLYVMAETLQKDDGTNDTVKGIARMKTATLLRKVMNPSREEIDMFEKLYTLHTLSEDDYFGNGLIVTLLARKYMFDNLRKPVPKFDWVAPRDGILTKVRYSKSKNSIDVPISFVLPPFFDYGGSTFFNYGALGFIISREFTHAFDNSGKRYDQHGNITKVVNEKIDEEYKNLSNCIIKKYGNYSSKSANLTANALIMQNENFADMAGLKIAYSTYEKWIALTGDEPKLPNIDGNPRKLFWISVAQTLCSKYNPQAEAFKIKTEAYFPDRFRVLGAMSNMPEFSNDFSCPAGSPMNPKEKCTLW